MKQRAYKTGSSGKQYTLFNCQKQDFLLNYNMFQFPKNRTAKMLIVVNFQCICIPLFQKKNLKKIIGN